MKTEQIILMSSIKLTTDLTKNLFVGFDGNLCSADSKAFGVVNADTIAGEIAPIAVAGIALVYSGAAISVGANVKSNSDGKAIAATNLEVTSDISGVTGAIPTDTTAVLSDAAQPTITLTGSVVNTVSGSVVPEAINGFALDEATGADELIRIKLI